MGQLLPLSYWLAVLAFIIAGPVVALVDFHSLPEKEALAAATGRLEGVTARGNRNRNLVIRLSGHSEPFHYSSVYGCIGEVEALLKPSTGRSVRILYDKSDLRTNWIRWERFYRAYEIEVADVGGRSYAEVRESLQRDTQFGRWFGVAIFVVGFGLCAYGVIIRRRPNYA